MENLIAYFWTPVTQKLLLSTCLGLLLGLEREISRKAPGIRTFTVICLGSTIFSIISIDSALGVPGAEPSRIAAQIVPGIGFLGAGAIFRSKFGVAGLTTAALMWITAAIGMAVGFGDTHLAVVATILTLLIVDGIGGLRHIYRRGKSEPENIN